jgi:hypothetical protein
MTDTNAIIPATLIDRESEIEKVAAEPTTTIAELPNNYDDSENIKVTWFRGTLVQTLIVGLASFLAPGAYAALAATGAGGLANVSNPRLTLSWLWLTSVGRDRERVRSFGICSHCTLGSRSQ